MGRRPKSGSRADLRQKASLQTRTKEGLIALYNRLLEKIESGKYPRDEEIRYMKRFQELLQAAEAREDSVTKEEEGLPEGTLKEFVERTWKLKTETGIDSTRDNNGLKIMEGAGYILCSYCNEFHRLDDYCPLKRIADTRKQQLTNTDQNNASKEMNLELS